MKITRKNRGVSALTRKSNRLAACFFLALFVHHSRFFLTRLSLNIHLHLEDDIKLSSDNPSLYDYFSCRLCFSPSCSSPDEKIGHKIHKGLSPSKYNKKKFFFRLFATHVACQYNFLFVSLLKIFQWFSPFMGFFKLKSLHDAITQKEKRRRYNYDQVWQVRVWNL